MCSTFFAVPDGMVQVTAQHYLSPTAAAAGAAQILYRLDSIGICASVKRHLLGFPRLYIDSQKKIREPEDMG